MSESINIRHEVLHSLKWVVIGRVATQAIRWAMTFWVIRLLSPEDYGIVAMADVVFGLSVLLIGAMFAPAIIQAKELPERVLRQTFGMILIVHVIAFATQLALAGPIGDFYQSQDVSRILRLNAWCFLFLAFGIIPSSLLAREMKFKQVSIIAGIANTISAIATFVLALLGYGFWALVIGELISVVMSTTLTLFIRPTRFWPEFRCSEVMHQLRFGSLLTAHSILAYVFFHVDVAIAGRAMSAAEVGLYAIGVQVALMPQKKLLPLINRVAFPAYSRIQDQPQRFNEYIIKAQRLSLLVTIPVFWGLALIADQLIPLAIGEKWIGAIVPTSLILIVMPLRFSEELFNPALKSQRRARHLITNVAIMLSALLVGIVLFLSRGATGLAMAWLVCFPISYVVVLVRNCRVFGIPVARLLSHMYAPICAGGCMVVAVLLSKNWFGEVHVVNLITQTTIGAIVFCASIWVLGRNVVGELASLTKSKPKGAHQ